MHFDDVATVNCTFCDLIAHLRFQMRKVLVTRNSNQTTRHSPPGGRGHLGTRLEKYHNFSKICPPPSLRSPFAHRHIFEITVLYVHIYCLIRNSYNFEVSSELQRTNRNGIQYPNKSTFYVRTEFKLFFLHCM